MRNRKYGKRHQCNRSDEKGRKGIYKSKKQINSNISRYLNMSEQNNVID